MSAINSFKCFFSPTLIFSPGIPDMNAGFFIIDSHVLFLDCSLGSDWVISKFLILPFFWDFPGSWYKKYNFLFILDTWFYVKRLWILFKSSVLARSDTMLVGKVGVCTLPPPYCPRCRVKVQVHHLASSDTLAGVKGVPVYSEEHGPHLDTMRMVGRYRAGSLCALHWCHRGEERGYHRAGDGVLAPHWDFSATTPRGPGQPHESWGNGESRALHLVPTDGKAGALFLSMVSDNYYGKFLAWESQLFWLQLSLPSVFWGCWFYQHLVWGKWGKRKHRNSLLCYCLGPKSQLACGLFIFQVVSAALINSPGFSCA